ncbi:50S ribosomal protein L17 [Phragmitibacter flavus]|uniref:Large ribosomal subunit protein bL17 n=1 Tax=Phragmitibacter flavus TaxID=2576071 RepID=A0A5R8KEJ0_9BACT|nr:50S ribosomal protein L17 [Phragmitibacter flavus]TLD69999.1 50S ribosomal protein L17 [Phragmitibacter flavus]
MRHKRKTVKLQRSQSHRDALLKNLCKSLIEHRRIRTTVAKAKAVRPVVEKLVTLGKKALAAEGANEKEIAAKRVHFARQAFAQLRDKSLVKKLFSEIAVASKDRKGGYTRITKLGQRQSDSAPMAFIEWVDLAAPVGAAVVEDAPAKEEAKAEAEA